MYGAVNLGEYMVENGQKENVARGYCKVQLHFRKLEDFSFNLIPNSSCYTSGRGTFIFRALFSCPPQVY